ncbi:hypothetical protein OUY22_00570 [Nonomuraea sp. MCN248]|uniref:Alpha/beta hydrolase n=1 Tax=Nonomuraea corallina TaxID=2989783 RepID=A0ABT4S3Y7_9ACTN|nr:hypothetical protein [Nonomuraea corallina]MDA0631894.1 hypothetical protein [Nonomuraea corallina]
MWTSVQRELALLGHRSLAVDLPGHGLDAQYPVAYQAPQDLDAWAAEPSTLAGVTLRGNVDPAVVGAGRADYRTADPELLAALQAATMADVTDERFMAFLNILQPDESLAVLMADARGQADHPMTRLLHRAAHSRSVGAAGRSTDVRPGIAPLLSRHRGEF